MKHELPRLDKNRLSDEVAECVLKDDIASPLAVEASRCDPIVGSTLNSLTLCQIHRFRIRTASKRRTAEFRD